MRRNEFMVTLLKRKKLSRESARNENATYKISCNAKKFLPSTSLTIEVIK